MKLTLPPLARRLWHDRSGVSALEFALVLPILAVLAVGTIEFGRLILLTQKLQNSGFILADLAARDRTLSEAQIANIFLALGNVIQPFEFAHSGTAILSGVGATAPDETIINWQRAGAGSFAQPSQLGAPGEAAALPEGLTMADGETIIVAEVFYDYRPIFGLTASPRVLRRAAYFKPRLGTLDSILP